MGEDNYREYLTASLSTLTSGEKVCLSFYVRNDSVYANDTLFEAASPFGGHFSKDTSFFAPTYTDTLPLIPQVEYTGPPIPADSGWFKISGSFVPTGGEKFLTLGNFRSDENTTATSENAYYHIDDVKLVPTSPQGLPAGGDTTVCYGDSVRLSTAVSDSVSDYHWSPSATLSDTDAVDPQAFPDSTTSYTVTKRTCCDTVSEQVTVIVLDSATIPQGLRDTSLCQGDSVPLSRIDPRAVSEYDWSPPNGLSDTSGPAPLASPDSTTNYAVAERTCGDTSTASVTLTVLDTPSVQLPHDSCALTGDSIGIGPSFLSDSSSVQWDPSQGLSDPSDPSPVAFPDSSTSYRITVTDTTNGCTNSERIELLPLAFYPEDTAICSGDSVRVQAIEHPDLQYEWSPDSGLQGTLAPDPIFHPDSTRIYTMTQRSGCDTGQRTFRITVLTNPAIEAGEDRRLPKGTSTSIGSAPENGVQYSWTPQAGLTDPNSTPTHAEPDKSRTYILEALNDSTGCRSRDTVRIEVFEPELYIPNVFAPSAKGNTENRKFRVHGGPFEEYHLQVFSRWGELVFETKDPNEAWKGRYKGELLKGGVYSYQFRGVLKDGVEVERSGTVTLLR
jgi:gliding motility-associated-like protein